MTTQQFNPEDGPLRCAYCGKDAEDLDEYDVPRDMDRLTGEWLESRSQACWREEGTLNREKRLFACSPCYIKIGQPSSPRGWTP